MCSNSVWQINAGSYLYSYMTISTVSTASERQIRFWHDTRGVILTNISGGIKFYKYIVTLIVTFIGAQAFELSGCPLRASFPCNFILGFNIAGFLLHGLKVWIFFRYDTELDFITFLVIFRAQILSISIDVFVIFHVQ